MYPHQLNRTLTFDELCSAKYKNTTVALFYGLNCKPCELLKPKLKEVCDKLVVRLIEFNASTELPAIKKLNLRSVPTVVTVSSSGEVKFSFSGDRIKADIERLLIEAGV